MKTKGFGFLVLAIGLAASASAQSPVDSTQPTAKEIERNEKQLIAPLSVGTAFNAVLITPLDTRHNKAGDTFTAEITENVAYQRSVIFPKGTLLIGHLVRTSAGLRGHDGAALFLQFDKAVLTNGDEALLTAGIQALAPVREGYHRPEAAGVQPAQFEPDAAPAAMSIELTETQQVHPNNNNAPLTHGAFTKDGLLAPDSQGALGMPDVRIYTPVSEGSNGTVLLSDKKKLRLEPGTRLLVVIQPPLANKAEH